MVPASHGRTFKLEGIHAGGGMESIGPESSVLLGKSLPLSSNLGSKRVIIMMMRLMPTILLQTALVFAYHVPCFVLGASFLLHVHYFI